MHMKTLRQSPVLMARPVSTTTSGGCSRRKAAPHERRGEEGREGVKAQNPRVQA